MSTTARQGSDDIPTLDIAHDPQDSHDTHNPDGPHAPQTAQAVEEPPAPELPAAPPTVGERLRAAREARGMDADGVATALKLSRRQIEALENGDWQALPGHTFIRGFVRNYARVVQIDADALLSDLPAAPPAKPRLDLPAGTAAVMPERGQVQKRDYAAVLGGIVLMAIAVVAYFVVPKDLWLSVQSPAPSPVVAEKQEAATPLFPPPGAAAGDAASPAEVSASAVAGAASAADVVMSANAVPDGSRGLHLAFAQPSWVEIRDRSGQVLMSQLNPAGSERALEGQPPFSLVIGNAAHVTVRYQGRLVELQPRSKDDVARVTVE